MPRNLEVIQRLFEEEGLAGYTVIHSYTWEFLPLDYDLLSLELPQVTIQSLDTLPYIISYGSYGTAVYDPFQFFRSHYLAGDSSLLPSVARYSQMAPIVH